MDAISPIAASTNPFAPTSGSVAGADNPSPDSSSIGPAASLELASLQLQSSMVSSLFGSLSALAPSASSLFAGASALSLLNAQGSSAMAYLTPYQAPSAGQTLDAAA